MFSEKIVDQIFNPVMIYVFVEAGNVSLDDHRGF